VICFGMMMTEMMETTKATIDMMMTKKIDMMTKKIDMMMLFADYSFNNASQTCLEQSLSHPLTRLCELTFFLGEVSH